MAQRNFRKRPVDIDAVLVQAPNVGKVRTLTTEEELRADMAVMEDRCLSGKKRSNGSRTIRNYKNHTHAIFVKMASEEHLEGYFEYSKDFIRALRSELEAGEHPDSTVYAYMSAYQEMWRANVDEDFYVGRPIVVNECDAPEKYHTPEEVEKLIGSIDTTKDIYAIRDKAALSLLYFAALRVGELSHLHVLDVDLAKGTVEVRQHGAWHPKNYQRRVLHVPEVCIRQVAAWIAVREKNGITQEKYPTLLVTADDKPCTEGAIEDIQNRRAIDAGLCEWKGKVDKKGSKVMKSLSTPHKLRHSRCSYLGNVAKWPIHVLSRFLMGHSSIAVTERYLHTNTEEQLRYLNATKEINVE